MVKAVKRAASAARICAAPRTDNNLDDKSFAARDQRVWNNLPSYLRQDIIIIRITAYV